MKFSELLKSGGFMNMQLLITETKRLLDAGMYDAAWRILVENGEDIPTNADTALLGVLALQRMNKIGVDARKGSKITLASKVSV